MNGRPLNRKVFFFFILCFAVLRLVETAADRPTYGSIYFDLGSSKEEKGDRSQAIKYYQKAIYHNPSNPLPYERLGLIAKEEGRLDEVIDYYKKAASLQSHNEDIYLALGKYFFERQDFPRAAGTLVQAVQIDRANPQICFQLGITYELQGSYQQAIEPFRDAIRFRYPRPEEIYYHLGVSYYKSGDLTSAREQLSMLRRYDAPSLVKDLENIIGGQ